MSKKLRESQWGRATIRHICLLEKEAEEDRVTIGGQAAEIERLQNDLKAMEPVCDIRLVERDSAREELKAVVQKRDYWKECARGFLGALNRSQKKHQKLSKIVHLAITPERYQVFHKIVTNNEAMEAGDGKK